MTLLVHWIRIRECNRMLDSLISVLLGNVLAVVIDELKSHILLVLKVLLTTITGIPEYSGWTHPGLLISETD